MRWKLLLRCFRFPNSKGLLLRRTYPELYRNHIQEIQKELKKDIYKYNDQKHIFTFINGSSLECGSCQYEGDVYNYLGAEYDHIGIDEASRFTKFQFNNFKTNLRSVRDDLKLQMYLGSNPGGVGHGWLKRLFMDKEYEEGEDPKEYKFIPAKVYDNTILMQKQPDYVRELETLPPDLKRAFLDGDWNVFAGQALRWKRDKHIIDKIPYPIEDCKRVIGYDWGYNAHGAAVFLAKTPDNHIFQYKEIYQNRKTPEEWATQLKYEIQARSVEAVILPHDCFAKQQGRDSIAEVFKRNGVGPIKRADSLSKNARTNGLALFHMYLDNAPDGIPYFQVLDTCVNTTRTLPELIYDENRSEDIDTDGEDHIYDAIRMVFLAWGKPKGRGGAVRPVGPEPERRQPTVIGGRVPALDVKKLFKKQKGRGWMYD
ncbi:MAG TPA: hypothetical protein ENI23_05105 [bacterium]|nr:hypothetical protein [bacterium]